MKHLQPLFLLLLLICFGGCGGGSEGTGTSNSISGNLRSADNSPISGASVTIIETGESTISNDSGDFLIETALQEGDINLLIETATSQSTVPAGAITSDSKNIKIDILLTKDGSKITAKTLSVWARMVGTCDAYFENRPIIRQSVKTPRSIPCQLKFFVSGGGERLERIPADIQVRACNSTKWKTIAEGQTGFGINAGFGFLNFDYSDSKDTCEYRLRAPLRAKDIKPLFVYIQSFTLQNEK